MNVPLAREIFYMKSCIDTMKYIVEQYGINSVQFNINFLVYAEEYSKLSASFDRIRRFN